VIVREPTPEELPAVIGMFDAITDELWQRPFPPLRPSEDWFEDKLVLVAEADGELVGCAAGEAFENATGHLNVIYVVPDRRRDGIGSALLREVVARLKAQGVEHLTLDVDTTNLEGQAVWDRLGFRDWARRMSASLEALERRLEPRVEGDSFGSVHVQTDDERAVEQAVRKYVPRLGSSRGSVVAPPQNGWIAVYDELCDGDPKALRRLATEVSLATGAVVAAFSLEEGRAVRYLLIERGSLVDEYLSVPDYYGPLPPGDAIALGANPTVVARLTGAEPAQVRAAARTAAAPEDLPPPAELLMEIASIFGIERAGHGFDGAGSIEGAVAVSHR
jgi:GNAT superfamily N-acetyltransferase